MGQQNHSFVPLILGTDFNAYGIVRTLYDQYGVHSHLYDIKRLPGTRWSSLVDVHLMDQELRPDHLSETMVKVATRFKRQGLTPVLYACGDDYARIVSRHYQTLSKSMVVPYAAFDSLGEVSTKSRFYRLCQQLKLPFPQTVTVVDNDRSVLSPLPFDFPVVVKADDNVAWHQIDFPHYRKVFVAYTQEELNSALDMLQEHYHGSVIVQEYIPGKDNAMYVVNGYATQKGDVAVLSLGHGLLNDPNPIAVGNYLAIMPAYEPIVYRQVLKLVQHLHIQGLFNVDLKYDHRDSHFKMVDFNPRQGRSSFYTAVNGVHLAAYPVAEFVHGGLKNDSSPLLANDQPAKRRLWLNVAPDTFVRYAPECAAKERALSMIERHRFQSMLRNSADTNPLRRIIIRHTERAFENELKSMRQEKVTR